MFIFPQNCFNKQTEILSRRLSNTCLLLSKLIRFDHEQMMKQSVEADINNLRHLLDQTTLAKSDLEMQIESLLDELAYIRKNHTDVTDAHDFQNTYDTV